MPRRRKLSRGHLTTLREGTMIAKVGQLEVEVLRQRLLAPELEAGDVVIAGPGKEREVARWKKRGWHVYRQGGAVGDYGFFLRKGR